MKNRLSILMGMEFFIVLSFCYAISDSNLSNNIYSMNVSIIETEPLNIGYLDMTNEQTMITVLLTNELFIKKVYPLSDNGYHSSVSSNFDLLDEYEDYQSENQLGDLSMTIKMYHKIFKAASVTNKTRAIGLVPEDYLHQKFPNLFGANTRGFALPNTYTAVVEYYQDDSSLIAHELGHTYLLCDEYDYEEWNKQNTWFNIFYSFPCPNANVNGNLSEDCYDQGCDATTLGIIYGSEDEWVSDLKNLMGYAGSPYDPWIANDSYSHLIKAMEKDNDYLPKLRNLKVFLAEKVLSLIATLGIDGALDFGLAYTLENSNAINYSEDINGSYRLIGYDSQQNTIINFSFEPMFSIVAANGSSIEVNKSCLQFLIDLPDNLRDIRIYNATAELGRLNVSANSPFVNITYPLGNEILENPFNITWTASDADDDDIYYAVLISNDNGSNYTTLDIDLNQTYYELDPSDYDYGSNYVIKVLATDGVNTGNNISNSFTLGNPLTISSLINITINNTHMVFQFIITNTGDTTLNNINWTLDPGDGSSLITSEDTFSLTSGKSAFIYVEYNYTTESDFIVNATANSGTLSSSKTLNVNLAKPTPSIGIELIYPTQNIDVTQNEFFNITINVSCFNADCGNINISLDPISHISFFEGWESGSINSNWSASGDPGTYDRQQVDDSTSSCTTIDPRTGTYR